MPETLQPGRLRRRLAHLAAVVAVVGIVVATFPGLGQVRHHLTNAQPAWLIVAVAAELASALSYVVCQRAVFCPCMRWGPSAQLGMSELAAGALLPAGGAGGLALGAWALHRGGMSSTHVARRTVTFFLLTSAANFAVVIAAGIGVALGLLPGRAGLALTVVPALLASAAVIAVLALARFLGRATSVSAGGRLRAFAVEACAAIAEGTREALTLLRSGRAMVILGSLGYLAFDIATMAACFQATGSLPPLGDFVLAYTIGQLGGLVPIPGGLGATDGGLIGAFVLFGASLGPVTAAVLIYRLVQLGIPALLGMPAFFLLQRTLRGPEAFATICEPLAAGAAA
jgi:uncharacterized protein (TIRG00374 family)